MASRLGQGLLVGAVVILSLGGTAAIDSAANDPAARFDRLGHKMMCTCGCAQVLLECNHVGCSVSGGMRSELSAAISAGQSDSQILDGFVARYGAVVLTAPTMHGFDLLAWIMPFAVALLGLLGTIFLVRHWAKQQPALVPDTPLALLDPAQARAETEMRERIRRETETDGGL